MDFFEKMGKRISDASQNVAQQTKGLAETTKLNSAISKTEKQIAQLISVLGQTYYENHKNDPSAEGLDTIAQINTLYAEIEANREKIKQIKGITKCANCGTELPAGASFCNVCGTQVTPPAQPEPAAAPAGRVCPTCQAAVEEGNLFCKYCGTKLS